MFNKKSFLGGILVGIVFVIGLNFLYNTVIFQFLAPVSQKLSIENKIKYIYSILDNYYVDDYDKKKIEEGLYVGLVDELGDPYTNYMDKETLEKFMTQTEGTYTGIGVVVSVDSRDNRIIAVAPYEGSPGQKAGILPGDKFIKVNGTPVNGDQLDDAVTMMKGKAGTTVVITIFRESDGRTFDLTVTREKINIPTVSHKMLDNGIGYLRITQFEGVTYDQFVTAYEDLKSKNMKSLVLDLRGNPGGLLHIVTKITDILVPKGYIVYTENKKGEKNYTYSDENRIEVPLAILVNGSSASASEVLSGAVKDMGVGVLVGTQTYGKGLVQDLCFLPDGSGVKVTVAKYYTPSGVCINDIGLAPDYLVELSDEDSMRISSLSLEEDKQLSKAIEVLTEQMDAAGKIKN